MFAVQASRTSSCSNFGKAAWALLCELAIYALCSSLAKWWHCRQSSACAHIDQQYKQPYAWMITQVERNLHDAMGVARNVMLDPRLVPGGGAAEMAISRGLLDRSAQLQGTEQVRLCAQLFHRASRSLQ